MARETIAAEVEAERGPRADISAQHPPLPQRGTPGYRTQRTDRLKQRRSGLGPTFWLKCAQKRVEVEGKELQECSFKPSIIKKRIGGAENSWQASANRAPFPERLYRSHDFKLSEWQRLKQEQEENALRDCTFSPQLNRPERLLTSYTPIHIRAKTLHREKTEKLARKAAEAEKEDPNATFAPALNPRSLKLAQRLREEDRSPDFACRPTSVCSSEGDDFTFAPCINPVSERLLEDSREVPSNFFERQRYFHEARQAKLRHLQHHLEDRQCTFHPETMQADFAAAAAARGCKFRAETYLERVERLACADAQRVKSAREAQEHLYYSQFTFHPEINPRSRWIGRRAEAADLTRDERSRAAREAAVREAEERLARECTFKPNIQKPGWPGEGRQPVVPTAPLTLHGRAPETLSRHIDKYKAARQAQLAEERERLAAEEMAECTFTPAINHAVPEIQGPVVVRGLDRHLELREMARQKEEEQRAREARVFIACPSTPVFSHTVPQPFVLQTEARERDTEQRRAHMKAALAAEAMRECTFAPRTNESRNRALIARILAGDDDEQLDADDVLQHATLMLS
eukprot:jgi/Botrbrau1/937/Bobra.0167s0048.1